MNDATNTGAAGDIVAQDGEDALEYGILNEFVGMHLRIAYERAYADFVERLGDDALRPGYFTILTLVVNNPGISQTQIGRAAGRDKSSITKALRWMEEAGLISRVRPDTDRRTHLSQATRKGVDLQARMEIRARQHLTALNSLIGADHREELISTLKRIGQFSDLDRPALDEAD